MQPQDSISIVIPVYNEQDAIENTLRTIENTLKTESINYEVIVVNDGSTDKTASRLEVIKNDFPELKVFAHQTNTGYGSALKTGCKQSSHDKIIIIDADGTYPIEQMPLLLKYSNDHDMVVGSRTADGAELSTLRMIPKFFLRKLAEFLSGKKIPDLNSGFRVFKKHTLSKYLHLLPNGFSFTTTITLFMFQGGYDVIYIPINYYKREGKSKIKPIQDTINFFLLIIKTILYLNPLKVFFPLSVVFFLLSVILMLFRIFIDTQFGITIVLLFTTGCQILAIGVLADLITKRLKE